MVKVAVKVDMGDLPKRLAEAKHNTLAGAALLGKVYFEATTQTFDHPVTFGYHVDDNKGQAVVGTDNEQYERLVNGFDHFLIMSKDFQPKTLPWILNSFPGVGGPVAVAMTAKHAEARHFDEAVAKELQDGELEWAARHEYGKLLR